MTLDIRFQLSVTGFPAHFHSEETSSKQTVFAQASSPACVNPLESLFTPAQVRFVYRCLTGIQLDNTFIWSVRTVFSQSEKTSSFRLSGCFPERKFVDNRSKNAGKSTPASRNLSESGKSENSFNQIFL